MHMDCGSLYICTFGVAAMGFSIIFKPMQPKIVDGVLEAWINEDIHEWVDTINKTLPPFSNTAPEKSL